ncbi:MAG: hypothetical protein KatS3mg118_2622 [Paracoccaceae bacterium]|nr:MAG: hypothetical protein KatS3mg118_2622 [Paracoccaceae bacterium]
MPKHAESTLERRHEAGKGWLAVLEDLARRAPADPQELADLKGRYAGARLETNELEAEILAILRDGPAHRLALDAIAPAFDPGDVIELRALDPTGGGAASAVSPARAATGGGGKTPHPAPSADLLRLALDALPNAPGGPFHDRASWMPVAHAVKGASIAGGIEAEGREAFI